MSAEALCSASAVLCGTEPVSALTQALFILLCSLYIYFLGFSQWQSHADRVVNLAQMCRPDTQAEIIAIVDPWS